MGETSVHLASESHGGDRRPFSFLRRGDQLHLASEAGETGVHLVSEVEGGDRRPFKLKPGETRVHLVSEWGETSVHLVSARCTGWTASHHIFIEALEASSIVTAFILIRTRSLCSLKQTMFFSDFSSLCSLTVKVNVVTVVSTGPTRAGIVHSAGVNAAGIRSPERGRGGENADT